MNDENGLHPSLTSPPMVKRVAATGKGQGLLLASLSHMMKTIIMSAESDIRPRRDWEMT